MQMLYNSDSYVVVQFEVAAEVDDNLGGEAGAPPAGAAEHPTLSRGGFEIVDKFARKEIFIEGALADRFRRGVEAIVAEHPQGASPETLDDYISGFTALAQNPVVLH